MFLIMFFFEVYIINQEGSFVQDLICIDFVYGIWCGLMNGFGVDCLEIYLELGILNKWQLFLVCEELSIFGLQVWVGVVNTGYVLLIFFEFVISKFYIDLSEFRISVYGVVERWSI